MQLQHLRSMYINVFIGLEQNKQANKCRDLHQIMNELILGASFSSCLGNHHNLNLSASFSPDGESFFLYLPQSMKFLFTQIFANAIFLPPAIYSTNNVNLADFLL